MNDEIDALLKATRETHPTREPVTHGSDVLAHEARQLRERHGLDVKTADRPETLSKEEMRERRRNRVYRPLAVAAVVAVVAYGGYEFIEYVGSPSTFSMDELNTVTITNEQGVSQVAHYIEGIETADSNDAKAAIESLPQNQEALSDGILQPGEQIYYPDHVVKP